MIEAFKSEIITVLRIKYTKYKFNPPKIGYEKYTYLKNVPITLYIEEVRENLKNEKISFKEDWSFFYYPFIISKWIIYVFFGIQLLLDLINSSFSLFNMLDENDFLLSVFIVSFVIFALSASFQFSISSFNLYIRRKKRWLVGLKKAIDKSTNYNEFPNNYK